MSNKLKSAFVCNLAVSIGFMAQGLIYFGSQQYMPYHADITGLTWEEVPKAFHSLILALIHGGGIGSFTSGLAIFILVFIPFRNGQKWSRNAIVWIGLAGTVPVLFIILSQGLKQDALPFQLTVLAIVFLLAGFFLSSELKDSPSG